MSSQFNILFFHNFLMKRIKRKQNCWSQCEDKVVITLFEKHGPNWSLIAQRIGKTYGSKKSSRQVRQRWHNHLNPQINKKQWSKQEQDILFEMQKKLGNKWSQIGDKLPGRNYNNIKNHFYSTIRKNLRRIIKFITGNKDGTQKIKKFKPSTLTKLLKFSEDEEGDKEPMEQIKQTSSFKLSDIAGQVISFSRDKNWKNDEGKRAKLQQLLERIQQIMENKNTNPLKSQQRSEDKRYYIPDKHLLPPSIPQDSYQISQSKIKERINPGEDRVKKQQANIEQPNVHYYDVNQRNYPNLFPPFFPYELNSIFPTSLTDYPTDKNMVKHDDISPGPFLKAQEGEEKNSFIPEKNIYNQIQVQNSLQMKVQYNQQNFHFSNNSGIGCPEDGLNYICGMNLGNINFLNGIDNLGPNQNFPNGNFLGSDNINEMNMIGGGGVENMQKMNFMGGFDNIVNMGFMDLNNGMDSWNMMGYMGHMGTSSGFQGNSMYDWTNNKRQTQKIWSSASLSVFEKDKQVVLTLDKSKKKIFDDEEDRKKGARKNNPGQSKTCSTKDLQRQQKQSEV